MRPRGWETQYSWRDVGGVLRTFTVTSPEHDKALDTAIRTAVALLERAARAQEIRDQIGVQAVHIARATGTTMTMVATLFRPKTWRG